MTEPADDLVFIAAIAGPHGVRGECKVKSFAGNPPDAFIYGAFLDTDGKTILTPKAARPVKDGFVVRFAEPLDRDMAQALKQPRHDADDEFLGRGGGFARGRFGGYF